MKNYQCPICGFSISEECKYCPECGNPLFDIHSLDDEPTDTPNDNLTDTFLGTKKKGEKKEVKKHFPIG